MITYERFQLKPWCCSLADSTIVNFWAYAYSEIFNIEAVFVLFTITWKIHFDLKMEFNSAIFFNNSVTVHNIIMWSIVIFRQLLALMAPSYIQYCIKIWLSKKFVLIGSHKIPQKKMLKKYDFGAWKHCIGISRWAKHNKICSHTKHFQANGRLFFPKKRDMAQ